MPIIICPLTGDIKETVQFNKAVALLRDNQFVTIVFTQLD
jgi:hypothetical protein